MSDRRPAPRPLPPSLAHARRAFRDTSRSGKLLFAYAGLTLGVLLAALLVAPLVRFVSPWALVLLVPLAIVPLSAACALAYGANRDPNLMRTPGIPYSLAATTGLLSGSLAVIAVTFGLDLESSEPFFGSASQVIPILLLTFAVERVYFVRSADLGEFGMSDLSLAFVFVIVAPAVAETLALAALAHPVGWLATAATVTIAIAVPASLVLILGSAVVKAFGPATAGG